MPPHCLPWTDLPEETGANGVVRRRLEGIGATLVHLVIPPGTQASRHSHAHEQFVQILSGSGVLETAQGRNTFAAGSLFHFPPDTWHAATFETETVLVETNLRV